MQVFGRVSQEQIVFGLAVLLCVGFAVSLPGFLMASNLLNLVRSVSILGILGVAMGLVVIGRGIDLSLVAVMAISVAWALRLATDGTPLPQAVAMGLAFSLVVGMINGFLIAYIEMPAIFATLAMGTLVYGFGRYFLFGLDVIYLPDRARSLPGSARGYSLIFPFPSCCSRASVSVLTSFCATRSLGDICARWVTTCRRRALPVFLRGRSSFCSMFSPR